MPNYIGYVQTANNAPTLFFDTGFLVQSHATQPAAIGWYAYRNVYRYGANMSPEFAAGIAGLGLFAGWWDGLNRQITDEMIRQHCLRAGGQVQLAGNARYVMVDTPHVDIVGQASFYGFASALMLPGDPGFLANFDAAYANAALGNLDQAGLPTQRAVVPTAIGITTFSS